MLKSKIEIQSEPFFKEIFRTLKAKNYFYLKKKANILVPKAARLLGVIDEYGVLDENELYCVVCEDELHFNPIIGDVFIVKNPCLHPGDVRKMKAVSGDEIKQRKINMYFFFFFFFFF